MPQVSAISRIEVPSYPLVAKSRPASERICRTRSDASAGFAVPCLVVDNSTIDPAIWPDASKQAEHRPSHGNNRSYSPTDRSSPLCLADQRGAPMSTTPRISRIGGTTDQLGESPLWDERAQSLYWIDSLAGLIRRLSTAAGAVEEFQVPAP